MNAAHTNPSYVARFAIYLLAFIALCATTYSNIFIDNAGVPNHRIDENAHLEYARHLIDHERWWPDFGNFLVVDRQGFSPQQTHNYLNHPPTFFWLAVVVHQIAPSVALIDYRILTYAIFLFSAALYMRLGMRYVTSLAASLWFGMMPFLLYLQVQSGFFNNDSTCLLGGMIVATSCLAWIHGHHPRRAYYTILLGLAFASVKLTSCLLVGSFIAAFLVMNTSTRRQLHYRDLLLGVVIVTICALPYGWMILQYGSPAPETIGQTEAILRPIALGEPMSGMRWVFSPNQGWNQQQPLGFFGFSLAFLSNFADQLSVRELTFLPLIAISASMLYLVTVRTHARSLALAASAATLLTLSIHIAFSWDRYQRLGWMIDSFIRYYFPLLGIYAYLTAYTIMHLCRRPHDTPR